MTEWLFHFLDRRTHRLMDSLPVQSCTFGQVLNGSGELSGQIKLGADGLASSRVLAATIPWRSVVAVQRENAIAWVGLIRPPRSWGSGDPLSFGAVEPLGVLDYMFLPSTAEGGLTIQARDLARYLVALQQADGDDQWITLGPSGESPTLTVNWNKWEFPQALRVLTELTERTDGIEFFQQPGRNELTGRPEVTLVTGHPRIGRSQDPNAPILEYNKYAPESSNIAKYTWSEGQGFAVRTWATSTGEEGATLAAMAEHPYLLKAGFPLLEKHATFDGVGTTEELQRRVDAVQAGSVGPLVTATFTILARPGLTLGDFNIGDDLRVRLTDDAFPPDQDGRPGYDGWMRIVGIQVSVDSGGVEKYELTMADIIGRW